MYDVECGKKIQVALIAGIIVGIIVVVTGTLVTVLRFRHNIGPCAGKILILI